MKFRLMVVPIVLAALAGGCTKYYRVTDPSTGKVYHTTEVKSKGSATVLKDVDSGNTVTIQNSEVMEISKDQYQSETKAK